MTIRNRIDHLLIDIKHLEEQVSSGRDAEILPVSFFTEAFAAISKLATELQDIEVQQIEDLKKALASRSSIIPERKPPVIIDDFEPLPTLDSQNKEIKKESEPIASISKDDHLLSNNPSPQKTTSVVDDAKNNIVEEMLSDQIEKQYSEPVSKTVVEEVIELPTIKENNTETLKDTIKQEIVTEKESVVIIGTQESISTPLYELIEKKRLADFRKAFNLNDRFRFKRELFGGDENKMNQAIGAINNIDTLSDALAYLELNFNWNNEDEPVREFITLLEKRYL